MSADTWPAPDGDGPPEEGLTVSVEHDRLTVDEARVRAVAEAVCRAEGVRIASVGVILGGHALVHDLNREWLEHDVETDVVSFVLDESARARGALDGEVYVDLDTAEERAPEFGTTFEAEALRYVAHGLLHLAGHDDATDAERDAMRLREDAALRDVGL